MNGEETEAKKIVASLKEQTSPTTRYNDKEKQEDSVSENAKMDDDAAFTSANDGPESDVNQYSTESSEEGGERKVTAAAKKSVSRPVAELDTPRRRSTRPTKGNRT